MFVFGLIPKGLQTALKAIEWIDPVSPFLVKKCGHHKYTPTGVQEFFKDISLRFSLLSKLSTMHSLDKGFSDQEATGWGSTYSTGSRELVLFVLKPESPYCVGLTFHITY